MGKVIKVDIYNNYKYLNYYAQLFPKVDKVLRGFEPRLIDSKSTMLTITLQDQIPYARLELAISRLEGGRLIQLGQ